MCPVTTSYRPNDLTFACCYIQVLVSTLLGRKGPVEAAKARASLRNGDQPSLSKFDKKRKREVDVFFTRWVVKKCRPASIGHDEELRDCFSNATGGRYTPPCASTVQKIVCELSAATTQDLQADIKDLIADGVLPSVSADIWGENGKSIYGCLLHYIDKNFVLREKAVLAEPFSERTHTSEEIEKCTKEGLAFLGIGKYNPEDKIDSVADEVCLCMMCIPGSLCLTAFLLSAITSW